jgi:hypothetical protein
MSRQHPETPHPQTEALLALMQGDEQEAKAIIDTLRPDQLTSLVADATRLKQLAFAARAMPARR